MNPYVVFLLYMAAILGVVALMLLLNKTLGPNRPYVPGIGVLPDWRRRGIGEQLMRLVLGAHRDVWLHAREGNLSARRLYARLGLRETMRVPLFYSDGETAIVIEAEMSAHDSRFGQQDRSV